MDKNEEIKRAERAKELMSDPLIGEIFTELEEIYFNSWKETQPKDTDARETMWQLFWAVGELRRHINVIVSRGEFNKNLIENAKKRKRS